MPRRKRFKQNVDWNADNTNLLRESWQDPTLSQLKIAARIGSPCTDSAVNGKRRRLGLPPRSSPEYLASLPPVQPSQPQPLPEPTAVSHPTSSPAKPSPAVARFLATRRPPRTRDIPDDDNDPDDDFCKGKVKAGAYGGWIRCQAAANKRTGYCDICGPKYRDR